MEVSGRKRGRPRKITPLETVDSSTRKRGRPCSRNSTAPTQTGPCSSAGQVIPPTAISQSDTIVTIPNHGEGPSVTANTLHPVNSAETAGVLSVLMGPEESHPSGACHCSAKPLLRNLRQPTAERQEIVPAKPNSNTLIGDMGQHVASSSSRKRGRPGKSASPPVTNSTDRLPVADLPPESVLSADDTSHNAPSLRQRGRPRKVNLGTASSPQFTQSLRKRGRPRKVVILATEGLLSTDAATITTEAVVLGNHIGETSSPAPESTLTESPSPARKYLEPWCFGGPTEVCLFCSAVVWKEEAVGETAPNSRPQFNICCQKGKVKLTLLKGPPEILKSLLDPSGGTRCSEFRRLIRSYNSIYAFTSMGGRVDNAINKGGAPYCFRLGGQNHHNIGSLAPPIGKQPRFMQLYFHDTENELTNRVKSLTGEGKNCLQPDIVEALSQMMYEHNAVAKVCKMARERIADTDLETVELRLRAGHCGEDRQFSAPTGDEFAALIIGNTDSEKGARDIVIHGRARGLKRISELHPKFMAMQYPLMFPYGEDGYRLGIDHTDAATTSRKKRKTVTMREYYAYRFQERWENGELIDGICVLCGRLRQQFMCDAFNCVEETRLDYVRHNRYKNRPNKNNPHRRMKICQKK